MERTGPVTIESTLSIDADADYASITDGTNLWEFTAELRTEDENVRQSLNKMPQLVLKFEANRKQSINQLHSIFNKILTCFSDQFDSNSNYG